MATKTPQQAWRDVLASLRESIQRAQFARATANADLATSRAECRRRKQEARDWCRSDRQRIRTSRDEVVDAERAVRRAARAAYKRIKQRGKRLQIAPSESDSLVSHNVPPDLQPVWELERWRFPYDLTPDERFERFQEWVHEHPEAVAVTLAELLEVPDHELRIDYERHLAEQAELDDDDGLGYPAEWDELAPDDEEGPTPRPANLEETEGFPSPGPGLAPDADIARIARWWRTAPMYVERDQQIEHLIGQHPDGGTAVWRSVYDPSQPDELQRMVTGPNAEVPEMVERFGVLQLRNMLPVYRAAKKRRLAPRDIARLDEPESSALRKLRTQQRKALKQVEAWAAGKTDKVPPSAYDVSPYLADPRSIIPADGDKLAIDYAQILADEYRSAVVQARERRGGYGW